MAANSKSRDTPYHLQYAWQVSCTGCCTCRPRPILNWTPYLVCVLGKIKNEIQGFHLNIFGSAKHKHSIWPWLNKLTSLKSMLIDLFISVVTSVYWFICIQIVYYFKRSQTQSFSSSHSKLINRGTSALDIKYSVQTYPRDLLLKHKLVLAFIVRICTKRAFPCVTSQRQHHESCLISSTNKSVRIKARNKYVYMSQ